MTVLSSKSVKKWCIIQNKYIILVGIISWLDGAIRCATRPSHHHKINKSEDSKTDVYLRLRSKLNNTEAKLTGVPPHCLVIVIVIVKP